MKRLIELAHSPHPKLKIIVAQNLKVFVKDFPELEDEAINAVYDLCEDQVTKVTVFLGVVSSCSERRRSSRCEYAGTGRLQTCPRSNQSG